MRRVAFVTGGARRLGRQITYFLADEGYELAVNYNSSSRVEVSKTSAYLNSRLTHYKFYKCDLRDLKRLKNTVSQICKDFGKIDLLINNAGVIYKSGFEDITPKTYDDVLDINLRAMLFTSKFALPLLKLSPNPSIINLASLGGLRNWVNYIPYCISKAAVIKLTALLAKSVAPKIRVNAIAPGTILIKGEKGMMQEIETLHSVPLKKYGHPGDIIEAIKFLINSDNVTGQTLIVDGGRSLI